MLLNKYSRGLVPTHGYQVLKAVQQYAQEHGLVLPEWVQPELSRAARNALQGYLEFREKEG
jgi:hypothetical protein